MKGYAAQASDYKRDVALRGMGEAGGRVRGAVGSKGSPDVLQLVNGGPAVHAVRPAPLLLR